MNSKLFIIFHFALQLSMTRPNRLPPPEPFFGQPAWYRPAQPRKTQKQKSVSLNRFHGLQNPEFLRSLPDRQRTVLKFLSVAKCVYALFHSRCQELFFKIFNIFSKCPLFLEIPQKKTSRKKFLKKASYKKTL